MGTTCRLPHWEEVVTRSGRCLSGSRGPRDRAPGAKAWEAFNPTCQARRTFKGLTAGVLFRPISGVPGPRGFLRGCGSRTRGPELRGAGPQPQRSPLPGPGGRGCWRCGHSSAAGPRPRLEVVPDGDPIVVPAARAREPPWGRGGANRLPQSLQPCAEGWTLGRSVPRSRTEPSTSWRPLTRCRSTRGWLTSRAAWTPGECPGGPRVGLGVLTE